jgi:hypothetical protein
MKADKKAFVALMEHIKKIDAAQRTVIMVQVENEVGTYGFVRDYAPKAQAAFRAEGAAAVLAQEADAGRRRVPGAGLRRLRRRILPRVLDRQLYRGNRQGRPRRLRPADVRQQRAARSAGIAGMPWKSNFASGGPTYDVIGIYKAAAPHIDIAAPDIYGPESARSPPRWTASSAPTTR